MNSRFRKVAFLSPQGMKVAFLNSRVMKVAFLNPVLNSWPLSGGEGCEGRFEGQDPARAPGSTSATPHGPAAYFAHIDQWRQAGTFEGLEFR